MFKGKKFRGLSLAVLALTVVAALFAGLVVAQTGFFQVPLGGLLFDQYNPSIRYSGRLSFQNLAGTLYVKAPLTATATLDFSSATTGTCSTDLTVSLTGVATGDTVVVSPPGQLLPGSIFFGWVSLADTVGVRHCNVSSATVDPVSGTYRVDVWGH